MLARAAAREDRNAEPAAHGVVVVVPVVVVPPVVKRPTVSVISVCGGCCVPPGGVWLSTIPSEFASVTSW